MARSSAAVRPCSPPRSRPAPLEALGPRALKGPVVAAGALISGTGTNLQAIIDRIVAGRLDCTLRVVVSNRPGAAGLARAEAAGIATRVVDHRSFASRADFDR